MPIFKPVANPAVYRYCIVYDFGVEHKHSVNCCPLYQILNGYVLVYSVGLFNITRSKGNCRVPMVVNSPASPDASKAFSTLSLPVTDFTHSFYVQSSFMCFTAQSRRSNK